MPRLACRVLVGGLLVARLALSQGGEVERRPAYDPLAVAQARPAELLDLVVQDQQRQRVLPLRVYLQDNAAARAWLDGDGPATILETHDRWQKK